MQRYIAFAWNIQVAERDALAATIERRLKSQFPDWTCVFQIAGLKVWQAPARTRALQTYRLHRNAGIVLGKIFTRDTIGDCDQGEEIVLDERESEKVQLSNGRHLVEHYWGRYVAIVKREHNSEIRVVRDPTGAVPCFVTSFRGVHVVFSDLHDCDGIGLINSSINWDHIAAYLWFDHLVTPHTGLAHVRQVQAGECVSVGTDFTDATYYWNPHDIQASRAVENKHQAIKELREVVQYCTTAWVSCYTRILHELSGGLDSAIVLSCLSRASGSPEIICENHFTPDAAGDERAFARQAAKLADVELIETPIRFSDRLLENVFESAKVATPSLMAFVPDTQPSREQLISSRGIQAIFSGRGGDHFFQRAKTRQIAAEYARRHGLRKELLGVISDTARFTRTSVWSVLATVLQSGLLRRGVDPYGSLKASPLLGDATRHAMDRRYIRHPWVDAAWQLPACKRQQIFNIIDTQVFYRTPGRHADIVHPLISQPIIELCLQIPSYVLTYGGIDRALARQAFEDTVAPDIITRTTKGATTGYFNRLLVRNLPSLREYLLPGILVSEGLLDKQRIEMALSEPSLVRDSNLLFPMLMAFRAELWLRSWISDAQQAAA